MLCMSLWLSRFVECQHSESIVLLDKARARQKLVRAKLCQHMWNVKIQKCQHLRGSTVPNTQHFLGWVGILPLNTYLTKRSWVFANTHPIPIYAWVCFGSGICADKYAKSMKNPLKSPSDRQKDREIT